MPDPARVMTAPADGRPPPPLGHWLEALPALAREAGRVVMAVYASDFMVRGKADASPVTEADEAAERVIVAGLRALAPGVPIVAEEAVAAGDLPAVAGGAFWLVDPLDGTREFVGRNGEFTVNIALVAADGRPLLGVVLAPALDGGRGRLWAGADGLGAWVEDDDGRRPIRARAVPDAGFTVLASRSHGDAAALDAYLAGRRVAGCSQAGSSLKLCLLAEGLADLYPRFGRTMAWDIAAGHAVLAAAGGEVWRLPDTPTGELHDGVPLRYGGHGGYGFENPHFVATGLAERTVR